MAKYDWENLEKEYILGNYKSVSAFLKEKGVPNNGSTRKQTSGWKDKKKDKEDKIKTITVQKTIEKQSEIDSEKAVKINDVANKLLVKIMNATDEINKNMDMFGNIHEGIVNRADIKKLTSALKDINDIISSNSGNKEIEEKLDELLEAQKNAYLD